MISMLCYWLIEPCLEFVMQKCDQFLTCSRTHLTASFLKLFDCMLAEIKRIYDPSEKNDDEKLMEIEFNQLTKNEHEMEMNEMVVANFFLSIVWSIGAVLKQSFKEKFSLFFNELCDNSNKQYLK